MLYMEVISKYNSFVQKQLDDWSKLKNSNYTPLEAKSFIENELIPQLDDLLNYAKNNKIKLQNIQY